MNYKPLSNEIDILDIAYKYVDHFGLAIDGGAYVGNWSKKLSEKFNEVFSFEPDLYNLEELQKNLEGIENIEIMDVALGDKEKTVSFIRKSKTGSYLDVNNIILDVNKEKVEMYYIDHNDLDDYITEISLIKLDLEGAEYLALKGAKKTIKLVHPVIILEDIPRFAKRFGHKPGMALEYLRNLGYVEKYYSYPNYLMVYDEKR